MRVTNINENTELVQVLETLLAQARSGSLTALIACTVVDGEVDTEYFTSEQTTLEMVGMSHLLADELTKGFNSDYE